MKHIITIFIAILSISISNISSASSIHIDLNKKLKNYHHNEKIHSTSSIFNQDKKDDKNLCNHDYQKDYEILVVSIEYNDQKILNNEKDIMDKFFGIDNSVASFYNESTKSKINIKKNDENNGYIKVSLDKNHPSQRAVKNDNFSFSKILELQKDIHESIEYIDNNNLINFESYDKNGNKLIETNELAIHFVVSGYEESFSDSSFENSIWAHKSMLYSELNSGYYITDYSSNGELFYNEERSTFDELFTIGVVSHELGHLLFCLPDLYSSDQNKPYSGDIGFFDLMGYGTWLSKNKETFGTSPSHFSYWTLSSMNLIESKSDKDITFDNTLTEIYFNDFETYKKITLDEKNSLLIEARGKIGYDKSQLSSGLVITKVTENENGSIDIGIWEDLESIYENYYYTPIHNIDFISVNKNSNIENITFDDEKIYFNYINTKDKIYFNYINTKDKINEEDEKSNSGGSIFYFLLISILLFKTRK